MKQNLYTPASLPAFKANSAGWVKPRPSGDLAAALMPETREIKAPWGVLTGIAGQHYHQVKSIDPMDEYPNDQFLEDFKVIKELTKGEDPRGDRLFELYGEDTKVLLAKKTKPVIVLGVADVDGEYVTSESSTEKPYPFKAGHIFVTNLARNRYWVIAPEKLAKLYDDNGIRPGLPTEADEN